MVTMAILQIIHAKVSALTKSLIAWDPSCQTWTGATNTDWLAWKNNATHTYYNHTGACLASCPSGFYGNNVNLKCDACHYFCTSWYGNKSKECTACDTANRYILVSPDTWIYLEWPTSTYYNSLTNSCSNCNSTCLNWVGPQSTNCIDCPVTRFLSSITNECQLWTEINSGLRYEVLLNRCIENWGKGSNLGTLGCDDNNTISGDGCDSNWKVEADWSWEGGNETTPDTCKSLIGPECEFAYISSSSYLGTITWLENVTFAALNEGDIEITIEGPLSPYSFDFAINETTGWIEGDTNDKFKIQFTFKSSLSGYESGKSININPLETITVKFINKSLLVDEDGNGLSTDEIYQTISFFLVVLSDQEKAAAGAQSNAGLFTMLLTFGTSTFISVALGGTIEATWLLFGSIQMMSFIPLLNLNLPANFREFSKNLAALHGEPGALPNLFENVVENKNMKPYNDYFSLMGRFSLLKYRIQNRENVVKLRKKNRIMDHNVFNDGGHLSDLRFTIWNIINVRRIILII